jgi:hypothetical protein
MRLNTGESRRRQFEVQNRIDPQTTTTDTQNTQRNKNKIPAKNRVDLKT